MKTFKEILESNLNEGKIDPKKLKKGKKVRILNGPHKGQLATIVDWDGPDKHNPNYQLHLKKMNNKIGYYEDDEVEYA